MRLDAFIGAEEARARVAAGLDAGTLFHAWLICGEAGCGAGYFARLLAADILQSDAAAADGAARGQRVLDGQEPDCMEIEGEGASGQIRVERVRAVRAAARETSLGGARRVVILYGVDRMAAPAANALLKILEEPPADVWFLLVARDAAGVLATIRSRCGQLTITPPSVQACAQALVRRGLAPKQAERLAAVWQGRVGAALAVLEGERQTLFETACDICDAVAAQDAWALMRCFAPYEKQREALQTLLADSIQLARGAFLGLAEAPLTPAMATRTIRLLQDTAAALSAGGNPRLVLTGLCLQLGA